MRIPFWVPSLWIGAALLLWPAHLWLVLIGYHTICLFGASKRNAWKSGRVDANAGAWIALALAFLGLAYLIPQIPGFPAEAVRNLATRWPGGLRGQAIYAVLVNAPLEEAYWRGALVDGHREWSLLQHGAAFGLHHGIAVAILFPWPWIAPAFLLSAAAGMFWTWLARRNDGIAIPITTHALSDLAILALVALQVKAALS